MRWRSRRCPWRLYSVSLGAGRSLVFEPLSVYLDKGLIVSRNAVLFKNSRDRANWFARRAVYALVRVNIEHPVSAFFIMNAIDGAYLNAGCVQNVYACRCDDIRHFLPLF